MAYYGGGGYGGGGRSGGYGDGGWGGGGYSRNFGGYGGGYRSGGGDRYDRDDRRDRDRDRYDRDRRSGGDRYGGGGRSGGGGYDRRSGGGGHNDRRSGGGGGGGFRGGRGGGGFGGQKRDHRGGGGPPSKFQKQESENNWEDKHEMMQSRFMSEKPENFEEEWMFLVCPPGKRRFLVAAYDTTESYNNAGAADLKFHSCLPSGSAVLNEVHKEEDLTILDTVYSPEKKCFYIVDLVHWKHYPYLDTEADFRSFVLTDKYDQLKTPTENSKFNEHPLHLLKKYPCTRENIEDALKKVEYKVEGMLFLKKDSLYVPSDSDHCLWLKLDKMNDLLGIPVPEGVNFAATNTKDEKKKTEQEERDKARAERKAISEKYAKEREEEQAKKSEEGVGDGGDAVEAVAAEEDNQAEDGGYYAPPAQETAAAE